MAKTTIAKHEIKTTDNLAILARIVQIHVKRITAKNTNHSNPVSALGSFLKTTYRRHRGLHNNIVAMSRQENPASNIMLFRFNGEIIGYQYAMKDRNTMRLRQTSFDGKMKRYSPGFRGVFDYIIKTYESDEIRQVDFLRGSEQYKYDLGCVDLQLLDFTLWLPSVIRNPFIWMQADDCLCRIWEMRHKII